MKGIVLCGGLGTRLYPLTITANKHLLPVYDQPMIYYPIKTLVDCGIDEILIVTSGPHAGDFVHILKNGQDFGIKNLQYAYQDRPDGGIADALKLGKNFANGDKVAVILGDNTMDCPEIQHHLDNFKKTSLVSNAQIFLKKMVNPSDFGVPRFENQNVVEIIEKPQHPPSEFAVIGLYLYTADVFDILETIQPSARNQLEITSVNNEYCRCGTLSYGMIDGFWQDAGTFDNLFLANQYWRNKR